MAHATPCVQQGVLITHESSPEIALDTPAWFAWLAEHRVFRFVTPACAFTARRERRAAGWYWYAYRRQRGTLRSVYLGKTEELTCARLNEATLALRAHFLRDSRPADEAEHSFLLAAKIARPALHTLRVARPRLTTYVHAHAACKLLLVVGPAGSGKTTLLSEAFPERVAWVSLDEGDNDLTRFWRYVLEALYRTYPGVALHVQTLLPALQAEAMEPFFIPLLNSLASLPEQIVLVLDDYHLLTSQGIHASLTFLLEHAPDQLHLVISSRVQPPLPLPRLRARGELAELQAVDLRFTQLEAAALLKLFTTKIPPTEEVQKLLEYTEGWATGLYLASLSERVGQVGAASPPGAYEDQRALFAYLTSEVLTTQPEHVQTFLLCSSILERFCAELCDAVLLQETSQALLQQLEHDHLFLSALDTSHTWYRYHALFADFLRVRLQETLPEQVSLLHCRAAGWYAHEGMPAEAIAHALQGDDTALAARLVEEHGRSVLMHHEIVTLQSWLRALPEEMVASRPRLCLLAAWAQMHTSHIGPVEGYLCAAERGLADNALSDHERQMLSGEIAALRARAAIYQGRGEQGIALARQALRALEIDDYYVRGEVALSMGTANGALGEVDAAEAAYREAIELSWKCGNLRAALLTVRSLGLLYLDLGRLSQTSKLYKHALERVLEQGQEHLPPVGFLHIGLGELYYEWNNLAAAERHLREGVALGQRGGDVKIWLLGYFKLLFTALARGDGERSWQLLAEAERLAYQASFARGMTWAEQERVRLSAMQGDSAPLLTWLQECGLDPDAEPAPRHEYEYYRLAQALIARQEPERASGILHYLYARAEQTCKIGVKIPLLLTMAQAYQAQGEITQALEMLSQALTLAAPQGYMRVFLDEGTAIMTLLSKLHSSVPQPLASHTASYLNRLLRAFHAEPALQQNGPGDMSMLPEQLSQRELEVLSLLAAGYSNANIAEALIIGLNTVKTHLKNIYGKLEVSTRTQAIARARVLHLL